MKNPKELKARFPYMFRKAGPYDLGFHKGWFLAFVKLCEEIDEVLGDDKRGFRWLQLKEKFGSARYYWGMRGRAPVVHVDVIGPGQVTSLVSDEAAGEQSALYRRIADLVRQATEATKSMCIVCGRPGALSQDRSWILVLCDKHAAQDRRGKLEQYWFDEDEE